MSASPHRKESPTAGSREPPLRVLSLDGGGVRGYAMLIILQELMHRIFVETHGYAPRRDQIPKPADHFDLIVGTGTGGLVAIQLGRLRLDIETGKELWVRMTRFVFETDKTIAGIPYRSTLYKASKLEEAIKGAVMEHTAPGNEGDDSTDNIVPPSRHSNMGYENPRRQPSNASVVSFSNRSNAGHMRPFFSGGGRHGNPNARLYDNRPNRCPTALTAMFKGTQPGGSPALLRSYDSRREAATEDDCKIWEAGRATSAVGLAFKPIQIGQTVFHDGGAGTYNPAPQALEEAIVNEWPGREIGVFISIGTGKRPVQPAGTSNEPSWYEPILGEYAEAARRLISKIDGCERIHEAMLREHLPKLGVNTDNYYRLNVEVGLGEFRMNEWNRLSEISSSTRQYLARERERALVHSAATKMVRIAAMHEANMRPASRADSRIDSRMEMRSQDSRQEIRLDSRGKDKASPPPLQPFSKNRPFMGNDYPLPLVAEHDSEVPTDEASPIDYSESTRISSDSRSDSMPRSTMSPSPRSSMDHAHRRSVSPMSSRSGTVHDDLSYASYSPPTRLAPPSRNGDAGIVVTTTVTTQEQAPRHLDIKKPVHNLDYHADNQWVGDTYSQLASLPYPSLSDDRPPEVRMDRKPMYNRY